MYTYITMHPLYSYPAGLSNTNQTHLFPPGEEVDMRYLTQVVYITQIPCSQIRPLLYKHSYTTKPQGGYIYWSICCMHMTWWPAEWKPGIFEGRDKTGNRYTKVAGKNGSDQPSYRVKCVHSKILSFESELEPIWSRSVPQKHNRTFWQRVWYRTVNRICISSAALYQFYKNSPKTCYSYMSDTDMCVLISVWLCETRSDTALMHCSTDSVPKISP